MNRTMIAKTAMRTSNRYLPPWRRVSNASPSRRGGPLGEATMRCDVCGLDKPTRIICCYGPREMPARVCWSCEPDVGGIVAPDGHYYPRCDTPDGLPPLSATPHGKRLWNLIAECLAKPDPEATDAKKAN
jgi:hypothetical protein